MELNKIYCESNLETMARMPDCFVDLTVTSPPYDDLRNYKGYSFPFEKIAEELYRVTKHGGVVVWVVGDATINGSETGTSFRQALFFNEVGFNVHDTMIWRNTKACPKFKNNRYNDCFHYMFILSKGRVKTFNELQVKSKQYGKETATAINGASASDKAVDRFYLNSKSRQVKEFKIRDNIWDIPNNANEAPGHPAPFPESLVADHIKTWSNEGELVYDCFMGSGTTAVMAHLLNRKWIGSEISKEYCEIANRRIKPYLQQLGLFPNGFEKTEGSVGKTKNYDNVA